MCVDGFVGLHTFLPFPLSVTKCEIKCCKMTRLVFLFYCVGFSAQKSNYPIFIQYKFPFRQIFPLTPTTVKFGFRKHFPCMFLLSFRRFYSQKFVFRFCLQYFPHVIVNKLFFKFKIRNKVSRFYLWVSWI